MPQIKIQILRYYVNKSSQCYFDPISYRCYIHNPRSHWNPNPRHLLALPHSQPLELYEKFIFQLPSSETSRHLRHIFTENAPHSSEAAQLEFLRKFDWFMSSNALWYVYGQWYRNETRKAAIEWCEHNQINYIDLETSEEIGLLP